MHNKAVMVALATVFLGFGGNAANAMPASASEADAPVKYVRTKDLDLSQPKDRKVLERRIGWAVMDVCPLNTGPSLGEMMRAATCRRKALRGTQQQVAALVGKAGGQAGETVLARVETH